MARDYKPQTARPARKKKAAAKPTAPPVAKRHVPGWLWACVGLSVGLFVAYGVHVFHTGELPGNAFARSAAHLSGEGTVHNEQNSKNSTGNKTRFEFYSLLPEMEVVVPETEVTARRRSPTERKTDAQRRPERNSPTRYILQAGAFRALADADRLKASLALSGLEATIQTVAVDGRDKWHRVRLGPFSDLKSLRNVRARLRQASIDAMVLKITI
ncbi:MAG: hypothetical protein ACI8PT_004936 [Gammaproteobacteria bacterium]